MKLVVGLGNPGEKYKNTRHNVGFMVVEELAGGVGWKRSKSTGALMSWLKINGQEIELFKPQKFMNRSGVAVAGVMKKHPRLKLEELFVVHDDLDIELGEYKIGLGKGPKDHNGLKSIYEQVGSKDFWHVRVGIDNRAKIPFQGTGEEYVLSRWKPEEREMVKEVIKKAVKELKNVFA